MNAPLNMRDLQTRRSALVSEMRSIAENPAAGDLSEAQDQQFEKLKKDLAEIEKQIERRALLNEAERRAQGVPLAGTGDDRFDAQVRRFSLVRAMASQVPNLGSGVDVGLEREVSAEIARRSGMPFEGLAVPMQVFERRVLTTAAPGGGPGGNLIATDLMGNQYIDRLRAALITSRLGARVLNGLVGNVDIPRLKQSAVAGWFAENAAISATDPQFNKVSLAPKHVGALTEFSRNMLLQSSPDIEELVRDDFAKVLAEAVDLGAIKGGGTNEPVGILSTSGIGDVPMGANGGPITWNAVIDLIAAVETKDAPVTGFATNAKVVKSARKTPKVATTDSVMVMESPSQLAGYPLASSSLVPSTLVKGSSGAVCSALIAGYWPDLLLAYWSAFDLLVNPYESTAYSKGNVQVRGIITMDVAVRHAESFGAIKDLTTP